MRDEYNPALNDAVLDLTQYASNGDAAQEDGDAAQTEVPLADEVQILTLKDRIDNALAKIAANVYVPNAICNKSLKERQDTICLLLKGIIKSLGETIYNIHTSLLERQRLGEEVTTEDPLTLKSYSAFLVAFMHRQIEKFNTNIAYYAIEPKAQLWARLTNILDPQIHLAMIQNVYHRRGWLKG